MRQECEDEMLACRNDLEELHGPAKNAKAFKELCSKVLGAARGAVFELEDLLYSGNYEAFNQYKAVQNLIKRTHKSINKAQVLVQTYGNLTGVGKLFLSKGVLPKFSVVTQDLEAVSRQARILQQGKKSTTASLLSTSEASAVALGESSAGMSKSLADSGKLQSFVVGRKAVPQQAMMKSNIRKGKRSEVVSTVCYIPPESISEESEESHRLGRLWWYTSKIIGGELFVHDISDGTTVRVKQAEHEASITCIHYDRRLGALWTGHKGGFVRLWDEAARAPLTPCEKVFQGGVFGSHSVTCITTDEYGQAWVGTSSGSVVSLQHAGERLSIEAVLNNDGKTVSLNTAGRLKDEEVNAHLGPVVCVGAAAGRVFTAGGSSAFACFKQWSRVGKPLASTNLAKDRAGAMSCMTFITPMTRVGIARFGLSGTSQSSSFGSVGAEEVPQAWQLLTGHTNGYLMVWAMLDQTLHPLLRIGPRVAPIRGVTLCEPLGMICAGHLDGDLSLVPIPHPEGSAGMMVTYHDKPLDINLKGESTIRSAHIKASKGSGLADIVGGGVGIVTVSNWGGMKFWPTAELRATAGEQEIDNVVPEMAPEEQRPLHALTPLEVGEAMSSLQALIEAQGSMYQSSQGNIQSRTSTAAALAAAEKSRATLIQGVGDAGNWLIDAADLETVKPIGEGAFGTVFQGRWQQTDVAIKLLDKNVLLQIGKTLSSTQQAPALRSSSSAPNEPSQQEIPPEVLHTLQREVSIMMKIRHPNTILFMGICLSPPCIVTEYCEKGSLLDLLKLAREIPALAAQLTWPRRIQMALDAARGMLCLHSHKPTILHRDLKSPNLLVDKHWHVKVTDFNLSKLTDLEIQNVQSSVVANNPRWHAPEIIKQHNYSIASDVYAFGLILWELLTWDLPFDGLTSYQIVIELSQGHRPEIPGRYSTELIGGDVPSAGEKRYKDLIRQCWAEQPEDRPTFAEVTVALKEIEIALEESEKAKKAALITTKKKEAQRLAALPDNSARGGEGTHASPDVNIGVVPPVSPFDAAPTVVARAAPRSPFDDVEPAAVAPKAPPRSPFDDVEPAPVAPKGAPLSPFDMPATGDDNINRSPVPAKSPFDTTVDRSMSVKDSAEHLSAGKHAVDSINVKKNVSMMRKLRTSLNSRKKTAT